MIDFSRKGRKLVREIAKRHRFSEDAVVHMMASVHEGGGSMAMFNHPEFGGAGQWMKGGMVMVSDMFNHELKSRVDKLCDEISRSLDETPDHSAAVPEGGDDFRSAASWWPSELGQPAASGSQNNIRYAYFPATRRLAVERAGHLHIYDTLDHRIGGVSQQQGPAESLVFTSQHGRLELDDLSLVSVDGRPAESGKAGTARHREESASPTGDRQEEIFSALERLAGLRDRGVITEEEFDQKKRELLDRL